MEMWLLDIKQYPIVTSVITQKTTKEKGLKYSIINADKKFFGNLMKQTKSTQVPQIVIDGEFVGDYDQLKEHLN